MGRKLELDLKRNGNPSITHQYTNRANEKAESLRKCEKPISETSLKNPGIESTMKTLHEDEVESSELHRSVRTIHQS